MATGLQLEPPWTTHTAAFIDEVMAQSCGYPLTTGGPTIASRLGSSAAAIFSPAFLTAYTSGSWGAYARFHDFFTANRIGPYTQTAPLKLYQGDADTTVLRQSTDALVAALRAAGNSVDYEVVPGGTHTNVAFGFVAYQENGVYGMLCFFHFLFCSINLTSHLKGFFIGFLPF